MDAVNECVAVLSKIEPFIVEVLETFGEASYLTPLETLVFKKPKAKGLLENFETAEICSRTWRM